MADFRAESPNVQWPDPSSPRSLHRPLMTPAWLSSLVSDIPVPHSNNTLNYSTHSSNEFNLSGHGGRVIFCLKAKATVLSRKRPMNFGTVTIEFKIRYKNKEIYVLTIVR